MDPFINTLKRWNARTWLSTLREEFSQKSEYSKASTLWDGMRNEQSSELST